MSAVPTAAQIRQTFLDFFKSKQHTIVPSDNVGYTSRDGARIFTNAGMNQFVPIFLGERSADVDTWPGVLAKGLPTRAADTQKCIRAGGKHNDLEDVGLDTYHHTLFEMLGNWSFGDYFKKEAIAWAWELVIERWKFPPTRVYATIYQPDKSKGDPADRDQEAWEIWAEKFRSIGLDPDIHIVNGNKKDNFWMMGDTGPCGPCTEIHIDLTPGTPELDEARQREGRKLVNGSDASCIEIWNNVFIQYNATPEGTFEPLPAKHVDTGMGFERVCSIIQGTKNFTDFQNAKISNYDTDVFRPIFDELTKMSGKTYASTLPKANEQGHVVPVTEQEKIDVAFRVIADHIRTLSFAIADGIQPGNSDRNYTLRRILRRASALYGRVYLGFKEPFMFKLVDVLADQMGDVFPEVRSRKEHIKTVIKQEEESFSRNLTKGFEKFNSCCLTMVGNSLAQEDSTLARGEAIIRIGEVCDRNDWSSVVAAAKRIDPKWTTENVETMLGEWAFQLYDTFGFPLDLTELMARERSLKVDTAGFERLMEEQRARARAAMKKNVISVDDVFDYPTNFVGYDLLECTGNVLTFVAKQLPNGGVENWAVVDVSPMYAEMGGQVGDTGEITLLETGEVLPVFDTIKRGNTFYLKVPAQSTLRFSDTSGTPAKITVNKNRRHAIERHHTVTHILHWALHEVVSKDATQKGSSVTPDKLTFDFNSAALTPQQLSEIERLVNERIIENASVSWNEVPYTEAKANSRIMQLFGEKYPENVRVVQIGGTAHALDGYSMELCGGTHTRSTGEIGLFRLVGEAAVAAGVRRIEAVAGLEAYNAAKADAELLKLLAGKVSAQGAADLEKKLDQILT
ncbi:alanine--tRNA ligase, partial [Prosthecobacter sp.]